MFSLSLSWQKLVTFHQFFIVHFYFWVDFWLVLAHTNLNFISLGCIDHYNPLIKPCIYGAPYLRPPCLTHHYRLACVAQTTHVNIYSAKLRKYNVQNKKNVVRLNRCSTADYDYNTSSHNFDYFQTMFLKSQCVKFAADKTWGRCYKDDSMSKAIQFHCSSSGYQDGL